MSDPHNPDRYGEIWPQYKIDAYLDVLQALKACVVFSGGWAWHFMSPVGHVEYKHAHDHKDLDLMVPPRTVATTMGVLQEMGFVKVATKYDHLPSAEDFRRYEKVVEVEGHEPFRLTIDFFVKDVPTLQCPGGWLVVRPNILVSYYRTILSSKSCWAVLMASQAMLLSCPLESLIGWVGLTLAPYIDTYRCGSCGWVGQFPEEVGSSHLCGGCQNYLVGRPFQPIVGPGLTMEGHRA